MLPKLQRVTLTEQAAQGLLDFIAAESMQPGDALPSEGKLALAFGVSRPIIREALKSLEGKGVITMLNGKGAIVKAIDAGMLQTFFQWAVQFDKKAILELMEVRRAIEVQTARLAAARSTPFELAELQATVRLMGENLNHLDEYIELDASLHLQIAKASHNTMLYHLVESLGDPARQSVREGLLHRHSAAELQRVQQLHESLLEQLSSGDPEGASQAMARHFDEAVTALVSNED